MDRRVMIRLLSVLIVSMFSVASVARVSARQGDAPTYMAVDIGAIKNFPGTVANAINAEGTVVGQSYDPGSYGGRAIIFQGDKLRAMIKGEKAGSGSVANDINSAGQIAGYTQTENGAPTRAVLWDGKEATDLGDLGGGSSSAYAINDAGVVVGDSTTIPDNYSISLPFIWQDGEMTALELLKDAEHGLAVDINADGLVVGFSAADADTQDTLAPDHAVTWKDGKITDLGTIDGDFSQARGVNAAGQVVGMTSTGDDQFAYMPGIHAVLWDGDELVDLGTLAKGEFSSAEAINEAGVIVGVASTEPGPPFGLTHAFVWIDGEMFDLNDLVESDGDVVFEFVADINDDGVIIASASVDGVNHAYVLTPIKS